MAEIITPKQFTRRDLLRLASIGIVGAAVAPAKSASSGTRGLLAARGMAMVTNNGEESMYKELFLGTVMRNVTSDISDNNLTEIGEYAFYACQGNFALNAPNVTKVRQRAFWYSSGLRSVNLPNCTTLENYAFKYCPNVTEINIPQLTTVGNDGSFANLTSLTNVEFPILNIVGGHCFQNCGNLTSCSIASATRIDVNAFQNCTSMTRIYAPNVTSFHNEAFSGYFANGALRCDIILTSMTGSSVIALLSSSSSAIPYARSHVQVTVSDGVVIWNGSAWVLT